MARETVFTCDNCGGTDTIEVHVSTGGENWVIDLCPACTGPILDVARKGRDVRPTTTSPRGTAHYDARVHNVRNLPVRSTA